MKILKRDTLPLGGFAGLKEHRIVTDSRLFGGHKKPYTSEGLGSFVYLADAQFDPMGETGMHPHREIDVISVMIDGQVAHAGSLEHGKSLKAGDVQVQRAGGEGFSHNEINPDNTKNRMIQLWALPEEAGQPAGYKYYTPKAAGLSRIYGGSKFQDETFDSSTSIDILRLESGQSIHLQAESLIYITSGKGNLTEQQHSEHVADGDLIRAIDAKLEADQPLSAIIIHQEA